MVNDGEPKQNKKMMAAVPVDWADLIYTAGGVLVVVLVVVVVVAFCSMCSAAMDALVTDAQAVGVALVALRSVLMIAEKMDGLVRLQMAVSRLGEKDKDKDKMREIEAVLDEMEGRERDYEQQQSTTHDQAQPVSRTLFNDQFQAQPHALSSAEILSLPASAKRIFSTLAIHANTDRETYAAKLGASKPSSATVLAAAASRVEAGAKIALRALGLLQRLHSSALDTSFKMLVDNALEALWTKEGFLCKPCLPHLKIIRTILDCKRYRDHLTRSQWKLLWALVHHNLFIDSDQESPTTQTLASTDRLEIARILFHVLTLFPKDVFQQALPTFSAITECLQSWPNELYCHPPLIASISHILHIAFPSNASKMASPLHLLVRALLPVWDRSITRDAFFRAQSHRPSLFHILRLWLHLHDLSYYASVQPNCNDMVGAERVSKSFKSASQNPSPSLFSASSAETSTLNSPFNFSSISKDNESSAGPLSEKRTSNLDESKQSACILYPDPLYSLQQHTQTIYTLLLKELTAKRFTVAPILSVSVFMRRVFFRDGQIDSDGEHNLSGYQSGGPAVDEDEDSIASFGFVDLLGRVLKGLVFLEGCAVRKTNTEHGASNAGNTAGSISVNRKHGADAKRRKLETGVSDQNDGKSHVCDGLVNLLLGTGYGGVDKGLPSGTGIAGNAGNSPLVGGRRAVVLQSFCVLFEALACDASRSNIQFARGESAFEDVFNVLSGLLLSDPENVWVYLALGALVRYAAAVAPSSSSPEESQNTKGLDWTKIGTICLQKLEKSKQCEGSVFLLTCLAGLADLSAQSSEFKSVAHVSTQVLLGRNSARPLNPSHSVSEKQAVVVQLASYPSYLQLMTRKNVVAQLSSRESCQIVAAMLDAAIKPSQRTTREPVLLSKCILMLSFGQPGNVSSRFTTSHGEFGFWPAGITPTERALEEWRFSELKNMAGVLVLERYDWILPPPQALSRHDRSNQIKLSKQHNDPSWLLAKLSDTIAKFSESDATPVLDQLYFLSVCKKILNGIASLFPEYIPVMQTGVLIPFLRTMTRLYSNFNSVLLDENLGLLTLRLLTEGALLDRGGDPAVSNALFGDDLAKGVFSRFWGLLKRRLDDLKSQWLAVVDEIARNVGTKEKGMLPVGNLMYFAPFQGIENALLSAGTGSEIWQKAESLHSQIELLCGVISELWGFLNNDGGSGNDAMRMDVSMILSDNVNMAMAMINLTGTCFSDDELRQVLDALVSLLSNSLNSEKDPWSWLCIIRALRMISNSILKLSNPSRLAVLVQMLAFFASEIQKTQVPWQLAVEFSSLMKECLFMDPASSFMLSDPETTFFSSSKGAALLPIPFMINCSHHWSLEVRMFTAIRMKDLVHDNRFKSQIITDVTTKAATGSNSNTAIYLSHCVSNALDNNELLYLFMTHASPNALRLMASLCSYGRVNYTVFVTQCLQMLGQSIAANSPNFQEALRLVNRLPLSAGALTTRDYFGICVGYFAAEFVKNDDYASMDQLSDFLHQERKCLSENCLDVVVPVLFSMANPGNAVSWISNELGGIDEFKSLVRARIPQIVLHIVHHFDASAQCLYQFNSDAPMKLFYRAVFADGNTESANHNNRISSNLALDVLDTMKTLFNMRSLSSLLSHWNMFELLTAVNERIADLCVAPERDRISKNGFAFLLMLGLNSLSSPLLLQMALSMTLKFLAFTPQLCCQLVEAILAAVEISEQSLAAAVSKVVYAVARLAESEALNNRDGTKHFMRLLETMLSSMGKFVDVQVLSLVFVDVRNPLFGALVKSYGRLLETSSDLSRILEEAIDYAIPGTEIAIVRFIRNYLENGKQLRNEGIALHFLNNIIASPDASSTDVRILATQCLAMLSSSNATSARKRESPMAEIMSLLVSCVEGLDPKLVKAVTTAILQILKLDGKTFVDAVPAKSTTAKSLGFFLDHIKMIESPKPIVVSSTFNLALWNNFSVSSVCKNLVLSFETGSAFYALYHIFDTAPNLALKTFPLLVHNIVLNEQSKKCVSFRNSLSAGLTCFFDNLASQSVPAIIVVVQMLIYLRLQLVEESGTFDGNFWADIDYGKACMAALKIKNLTAALLFHEIWSSAGKVVRGDRNPLLDIYQSLDQDGFDGVMSSIDLTSANVILTYNQHKEFTKALQFQNSRIMASSLLAPIEVIQSGTKEPAKESGLAVPLAQLGCYHGVLNTIDELPETSDLRHESLWRCGKWDTELVPAALGSSGLNTFIFHASKALSTNDQQSCLSFVRDGMLTVAGSVDLMDVSNLASTQRRLLSVIKLHELQGVALLPSPPERIDLTRLFESWENRLDTLSQKIQFTDLEPVISCRIMSLTSLLNQSLRQKRPTGNDIHQFLQKTLISYSKRARKAMNLQFSTIGLAVVKQLDSVVARPHSMSTEFEECKVFFSQGNEAMAIRKLKATIGAFEEKTERALIAKLYCKLAKWSDLRRSENPQSIFTYFELSSQHATSAFSQKKLDTLEMSKLSSCFYHFASFADKTYSQMAVDESHEAMKSLVEERQLELDSLNARMKAKSDDPGLKSSIRRLNNQIRFDRNELSRYGKETEKYLLQSIENYFLCLQMGDKWDISVFRLCALWFSNGSSSKVSALVAKHLASLSDRNRKFLPLIYQLSARMTTANDDFQSTLKELLSSMVISHPHHTIYQLIALKNGADSNPANTKTLNTAATELLLRLKGVATPQLRSIIDAADHLSDAYIELAMITPPSVKKSKSAPTVPIDRRLKLAKISNLPIPVVTADLPVSHSCDYKDLPTIDEFKKEYTLVGGINAPKVLVCTGSNGRLYKQLVKGGSDDLRQDATLSNVFSIMNILLKKNFETRQRGLSIGTYKVVPLGQRAGVIEWVDNTFPFGEYLTSAHARYHKTDLSSMDARKKMMQEHEREDSTPQSKLATFQEIESQFKPVFRHFFFESFRDPATWFKSRTEYTRSTAVTSILGWIVGLGDRHPQNTLIDRSSGAIIQIDLGIAFDQGKLLSTPELVPFRLTRDIIDAMGSTNIEGVFRRCCEETLVVARKEANIIYTILDVFRYDPLYNWKGAQSRNSGGVHSGKNIEAERALVGVKKKMSEALSVECQINELFLCAMNKENLSK
ncbi:hypothetical protein HDU80_010102, partial [Chytriomyces hyalinus]